MPDLNAEFLVSCLCAQWCGTCREYRPAFDAVAAKRSDVSYVWIDVEDQPEVAGDIDVDNFPTLVIQRGEHVLFCGPMVPEIRSLERLLDSFMTQTSTESAEYALGTADRRAWQDVANVRSRLRQQL